MSSKTKRTKKDADSGFKKVNLTPKTRNQSSYIRSIVANDITFCTGPAGTGKTHIAVGMAVQWMQRELLDRIIITRPLVSVGKDMGFLPGDIGDKVGPYVIPCFDELNYYVSLSLISTWQKEKKIEIVPLSMMRGRTFNNAFIILDEAQNATRDEMKMLLTRIGPSSKLVLAGDQDQTDLPFNQRGALSDASDRLSDLSGIGHVEFTESDIIRHGLISGILKRLW